MTTTPTAGVRIKLTEGAHLVEIIEPIRDAAMMLIESDTKAERQLHHFGHHNGRRRQKQVASPRPCIAHDKDQGSILNNKHHKAYPSDYQRLIWTANNAIARTIW